MTPEGLVASLAWSAVAGYAAWRADLRIASRERRIARHDLGQLALSRQQASDARALAEAAATAETRAALARRTASSITLPDDLEAVAQQETEEWARDNERQLMRERFVELHQLTPSEPDESVWQKVRRGVGIAEMP